MLNYCQNLLLNLKIIVYDESSSTSNELKMENLKKNKGCSWHTFLPFIGISTILFGLMDKNYYWALSSFLLTMPICMTLFSNPENLNKPSKKWIKIIFIPIFIIETFIWYIISERSDFLPHDLFYSHSFLIGEAIGFVILCFLLINFKKKTLSTSTLYFIFAFVLLTTIDIRLLINNNLNGRKIVISQMITDKHIDKIKGVHYNLGFDEHDTFKWLRVNSQEYDRISIGDTIDFQITKGQLGYDLFTSYTIKK